MDVLLKDDLPFQTNNAAIAFCLYISGIPFADEKAPLCNEYTAPILKKLGYSGDIEAATNAAYLDGFHGNLSYAFTRTLDLPDSLQSYLDTETALAGSSVTGRAMCLGIMERHRSGLLSATQALSGASCAILKTWRQEKRGWEQSMDWINEVARRKLDDIDAAESAKEIFLTGNFICFAAAIMEARTAFLNLWRNYPPTIRLRHKGNPHTEGKKTTYPGGVYFTTNTENAGRKDIGAPTK